MSNMDLAGFSWLLTGLLLVVLVVSFSHERRLYANAVLLGFLILSLMFSLSLSAAGSNLASFVVMLLMFALPLALVVVTLLFAYAGVLTMAREGVSLANSLSLLFSVGIWGAFLLSMRLMADSSSLMVGSVGLLLALADVFVVFSFVSLVAYSWLYRVIPRQRTYDHVIVLGAGLMPDGTPTPLLAARLDKAMRVWDVQGRRARFVVSGGRGADEACSEAMAMRGYLVAHGVPDDIILLEDASTSTYENMLFSKALIETDGGTSRCVFVTNDFHVFRAATYARQVGLNAAGVGCATAAWYWPSAFVREYIAILSRHLTLPMVIVVLWLLVTLLMTWGA
jgi:uncharacterized SAM-binding protein YcdF (DUF218 family)